MIPKNVVPAAPAAAADVIASAAPADVITSAAPAAAADVIASAAPAAHSAFLRMRSADQPVSCMTFRTAKKTGPACPKEMADDSMAFFPRESPARPVRKRRNPPATQPSRIAAVPRTAPRGAAAVPAVARGTERDAASQIALFPSADAFFSIRSLFSLDMSFKV